jgi:hypothetical protein
MADWRKSPVKNHRDDYQKSLHAKGAIEKHIKLTLGRVDRIMDGCEFRTLGDVEGNAVEMFMADLREEEELGHRIYYHYL